MTAPDRKRLEATLIEQFEAAQAITDERASIRPALADPRAIHGPHVDPNVEAFRRLPKNR